MRIAQLVIEPVVLQEPVECGFEYLTGTQRGAGGFGHTGE
jgi:dUTPase